MEYTKSVLQDLQDGQAKDEKIKKESFFSKIKRHKFATTVVLAIVGFVAIDMFLIVNFMNILIRM